ncbi:uncharacterized protein LOC135928797 [Gordionus sp. m RMFG-2023]|uniref:uncharacterized protein LOC135928797 n=1 Tax=Gordionus sp. m RMFG-2023 TaxID=3053472 RepID=UPI0031FC656B
MMISCVIKSVEDHGYILETGLPLNAFLPENQAQVFIKYWKRSLRLSIGQYLHCKVELPPNLGSSKNNLPKYIPVSIYTGVFGKDKIDISSLFLDTLNTRVFEKWCPTSVDAILPGSVMVVTIVRKLNNGGYEVATQHSTRGYLTPPLPSLEDSDDDQDDKRKKTDDHTECSSGKDGKDNLEKRIDVLNSILKKEKGWAIGKRVFPVIVTYVNSFTKAFAVTARPGMIRNIMAPARGGLFAPNFCFRNVNNLLEDSELNNIKDTLVYANRGKIINNVRVISVINGGKFTTKLFVAFELKIITSRGRGNKANDLTNIIKLVGIGNWKTTAGVNIVGKDDSKKLKKDLKTNLKDGKHNKREASVAQTESNKKSKVIDKNFVPALGSTLAGCLLDFDPVLGIAILDFDPKYSLCSKSMSPFGEHSSFPSEFPLKKSAALKSWVVSQDAWRNYESVAIGAIVHGCVVLKYSDEEGVLVKINERIRGFIPLLHLSDSLSSFKNKGKGKEQVSAVIKKYRRKFYTPGKLLTCRVIDVLPDLTKLIVTHKKSLINSILTPLKSYSQVRFGTLAKGSIVNIMDYGLLVAFYGSVKGIIRFASQPVEITESREPIDQKELYRLGQTVTCRVLEVRVEERKMSLAIHKRKLTDDLSIRDETVIEKEIETTTTKIIVDKYQGLKVGRIYSGVITCKMTSGFRVSVQLPGHKKISTFLPKSHLSDFPANFQLIWDHWNEGMEIENLLCLSLSPKIILTNKSFYKRIKDPLPGGSRAILPLIPNDNSDRNADVNTEYDTADGLLPGIYCVGKIKTHRECGLIVNFPDGTRGLVHRSHFPGRGHEFNPKDRETNDDAPTDDKIDKRNKMEVKREEKQDGHLEIALDGKQSEESMLNTTPGATIMAKVLEVKCPSVNEQTIKANDTRTLLSLTLADRDINSDRRKVSFGDKGATMLDYYWSERMAIFSRFSVQHSYNLFLPGQLLKAQYIIAPQEDGNAYFVILNPIKSDIKLLCLARIPKTEGASPTIYDFKMGAIADENYEAPPLKVDKKYDVMILHPVNIKESDIDHNGSPTLTYSAMIVMNHNISRNKDSSNFESFSSLANSNEKDSVIEATILGLENCENNVSTNNSPRKNLPNEENDKRKAKASSYFANVLLELNKKSDAKDGKTINGIKNYFPAFLPLYWDFCDVLPKVDSQDLIVGKKFKVQISCIESKFKYVTVRSLKHSYIPQSSSLHTETSTNDLPLTGIVFPSGKFRIAKRAVTHLELEPMKARIYVDQIYERFFGQTHTNNKRKILNHFPRGSLIEDSLYVMCHEKVILRKRLALTHPGIATTVPILGFAGLPSEVDSRLLNRKPYDFKIDEQLTCFVECVQPEKRKITFFVNHLTKAVCMDVDLSINKKIISNVSLKFKRGRVCKGARVINIVSTGEGGTERVLHLSLIHDSFDQTILPPNSLVCGLYLRRLPDQMGFLFKLPRNRFGIASIFNLRDLLADALKFCPDKRSLHKCRILNPISPILDTPSKNRLLKVLKSEDDEILNRVYLISLKRSKRAENFLPDSGDILSQFQPGHVVTGLLTNMAPNHVILSRFPRIICVAESQIFGNRAEDYFLPTALKETGDKEEAENIIKGNKLEKDVSKIITCLITE